jgi:polyhydroxybutyrate depolymerase
VYAPADYDSTRPTPLVFNLHGFQSNAEQQQALTFMNRVADENNFLVAVPQGLGRFLDQIEDVDLLLDNESWNAGNCCSVYVPGRQNPDDVGFFRALLEYVAEETNLDRDRVYSTGMSNGGLMRSD